jgi:predicted metalloprotease with PDZ domain
VKSLAALAILTCSSWLAHAQQEPIRYALSYSASGHGSVHISLELPEARPAPMALVIPRGYPGGYGVVLYDRFVRDVRAFSDSGKPIAVTRAPDGPRWNIGGAGDRLARVEYRVDLEQMENDLAYASDSSKMRPRYLGLLGYSVFGYFDGLEAQKINLRIEGPADWPVFSTLAPAVPAAPGRSSVSAANYYALADSQILMGPDLQLRRIGGKIDLVVASYSEGEADLAQEGALARTALDRVQEYFGDTPFPTYSACLEFLQPRAGHDYSFSQEHLNSGTFGLGIQEAITGQSSAQQKQRRLFNYAHHIAHSWIPKRAYGEGYAPFNWEMLPVIDTIWFNEGFGQYVAVQALSEGMPEQEAIDFRRHFLTERYGRMLSEAPPFIRRMPLAQLSREASFLYSIDFRSAMNTFARGALMAGEMDERIQRETHGKKSLRDGLGALVKRTQEGRKAFRVEELPVIFKEATSVDVSEIMERWLRPQSE